MSETLRAIKVQYLERKKTYTDKLAHLFTQLVRGMCHNCFIKVVWRALVIIAVVYNTCASLSKRTRKSLEVARN